MAWVRPTKKQRRAQHQQTTTEFHQTDAFQNALQYFSCKPVSAPPLIDHTRALKQHHHHKPQKLLEAPPPPMPPTSSHHHRSHSKASTGAPSRRHHHRNDPPDHDIVLVEEEDDNDHGGRGGDYLTEVRRAVRQEMQNQFNGSARESSFSSSRRHPQPLSSSSSSKLQYESAILRPKPPPINSHSFLRERQSYSHMGTGSRNASSRWAGATSALPGLC